MAPVVQYMAGQRNASGPDAAVAEGRLRNVTECCRPVSVVRLHAEIVEFNVCKKPVSRRPQVNPDVSVFWPFRPPFNKLECIERSSKTVDPMRKWSACWYFLRHFSTLPPPNATCRLIAVQYVFCALLVVMRQPCSNMLDKYVQWRPLTGSK